MDNEKIVAKARLAADFMNNLFEAISATNVAAHAASPEAAMVNDVLKAMKR